MVLMLKEYKVFSMSINLNVSTPSSIEFQGALSLKDSHSNSEEVEITDVFHCDGLLLCTTNDNRLVVWNPCMGETRWIQRKTGYESSSKFALGYIQNNKSCRSYKILRRWGCSDAKQFEIYEFSSDSWRVLDDVVLDSCVIIRNGYSSGASSLEGNTYWLAYDKKEEHQFILSFDFTAEILKHMGLPPFQNRGFVTVSVGREEQLSALNWSYNNPSMIEMWVTNKIDADELFWSKSFIVDLPIVGNCFISFTSLLIDAEKKVSLCCSVEGPYSRNLVYTIGEDDEYYTETLYTNRKGRPVIFNYVPSLIQIKKAEKKSSSD